jgi:putative membrane protein
MYGEGGMLFDGFMWVFWLLVISAVVLVIISAINNNTRTRNDTEDSPLEILKRRYARGEIDEDEFIQRRKGLEN